MSNNNHSRSEEDVGVQPPRASRSLLSELIESQHRAKTLADSASSGSKKFLEQPSNEEKSGLIDAKSNQQDDAEKSDLRHLNRVANAPLSSSFSKDELHDCVEQPVGLLSALLEDSASKVSKQILPSRGECLTFPSELSDANGFDNVDGNLVVHVLDSIKAVNRNIDLVDPSQEDTFQVKNNPLGITTFQIIELLGQGTFAQVFKCKDTATGHLFAIKIVKNKPAFTMQAKMEIEIFRLLKKQAQSNSLIEEDDKSEKISSNYFVSLLCHFMFKNHLCLVFELLGQNLYELLKKRQFRGLPLKVVQSLIKQSVSGLAELGKRKIVHCDLKPENILIVSNTLLHDVSNEELIMSAVNDFNRIKLIDFGSACVEGQSTYSYIQSRFYRSPEVLIGINYDSAIDMWSLGCVAAELFLGLPILPGFHEHDQLSRIVEMIGIIPQWMLEQGKKTSKFFSSQQNQGIHNWKMKTREEFSKSLSKEEIEKYGGMSKIEAPPANRYFDFALLRDIVLDCGKKRKIDERRDLIVFIHFLKGLLNPDPCERWTAYQASTHPFINGTHPKRTKSSDSVLRTEDDINWSPPWDPAVATRKLSLKKPKLALHTQRSQSNSNINVNLDVIPQDASSYLFSLHSDVMYMTNNMSLSHNEDAITPTEPREQKTEFFYMSLPNHHAAYGQAPFPATYQGIMQPPISVSSSRFIDQQERNSNSSDQTNVDPGHRSTIGAQSYSGIHYPLGRAIPQGDFGYALQRPGVFPGGLHSIYAPPQHINGYSPQFQNSPRSSYSDMNHFASGSYSSYQTRIAAHTITTTSISMPPHLQTSRTFGTPHHQFELRDQVIYQNIYEDTSQSHKGDESQYLHRNHNNRSSRATNHNLYRGSSM